MVVGNGMIASAFSSYRENNEYVIYAAGVSHSKLNDNTAFQREQNELDQFICSNPGKIIIYFSTASISDSSLESTLYIRHKCAIENKIKQSGLRHMIVRTTNIVGRNGNPNTVFNFFRNAILNEIPFEVWNNTFRNFLDVDDLVKLVNLCIKENRMNETITLANSKSIATLVFVRQLEQFLNKHGNYTLIDKSGTFEPDYSFMDDLAKRCGIVFDENYLGQLMKKYIQ